MLTLDQKMSRRETYQVEPLSEEVPLKRQLMVGTGRKEHPHSVKEAEEMHLWLVTLARYSNEMNPLTPSGNLHDCC